jgi:hypothetical protein
VLGLGGRLELNPDDVTAQKLNPTLVHRPCLFTAPKLNPTLVHRPCLAVCSDDAEVPKAECTHVRAGGTRHQTLQTQAQVSGDLWQQHLGVDSEFEQKGLVQGRMGILERRLTLAAVNLFGGYTLRIDSSVTSVVHPGYVTYITGERISKTIEQEPPMRHWRLRIINKI